MTATSKDIFSYFPPALRVDKPPVVQSEVKDRAQAFAMKVRNKLGHSLPQDTTDVLVSSLNKADSYNVTLLRFIISSELSLAEKTYAKEYEAAKNSNNLNLLLLAIEKFRTTTEKVFSSMVVQMMIQSESIDELLNLRNDIKEIALVTDTYQFDTTISPTNFDENGFYSAIVRYNLEFYCVFGPILFFQKQVDE
jgi:hypothetical protein